MEECAAGGCAAWLGGGAYELVTLSCSGQSCGGVAYDDGWLAALVVAPLALAYGAPVGWAGEPHGGTGAEASAVGTEAAESGDGVDVMSEWGGCTG